MKKVFVDYIDFRQGHRAMVDAVEAGIKQKGKLALDYMALGAKVLDRSEEKKTRRVVNFRIFTNVDPFAMRKAGERHGLLGRPTLESGY